MKKLFYIFAEIDKEKSAIWHLLKISKEKII